MIVPKIQKKHFQAPGLFFRIMEQKFCLRNLKMAKKNFPNFILFFLAPRTWKNFCGSCTRKLEHYVLHCGESQFSQIWNKCQKKLRGNIDPSDLQSITSLSSSIGDINESNESVPLNSNMKNIVELF